MAISCPRRRTVSNTRRMFSEVTTILHLGPIRGCISSINLNPKEEAFAWCTRRTVEIFWTFDFATDLKESLSTRQCPLYIYGKPLYSLRLLSFFPKVATPCPILLFLPNMKKSKNYIAIPPNLKSVDGTCNQVSNDVGKFSMVKFSIGRIADRNLSRHERSAPRRAKKLGRFYQKLIEDEWPALSYPNKKSHRLPYLNFLWMKPFPKRHNRAPFLNARKAILVNSEGPLWRLVPSNILGQYVASWAMGKAFEGAP